MRNYKNDLSIIIITMNRQEQLIEALNSCIKCTLPTLTNFIIIDNASTDNTESAVNSFFEKTKYEFLYKKLEQNEGVGGGRNVGFDEADGKYLYFLDDDAVIDEKYYSNFFLDIINFMEENPSVATLTTRITDEMLKRDRRVTAAKNIRISGCPSILYFLGGSHLLRSEYFKSPLYLDIKYSNEELVPSFYAIDNGWYNVYYDKVRVIHRPKIDKWVVGSETFGEIIANEVAVKYATKRLLYPKIFIPMIWMAYILRCYKYRQYKDIYKESKELVEFLVSNNSMKKIKVKTVLSIFFNYGLAGL